MIHWHVLCLSTGHSHSPQTLYIAYLASAHPARRLRWQPHKLWAGPIHLNILHEWSCWTLQQLSNTTTPTQIRWKVRRPTNCQNGSQVKGAWNLRPETFRLAKSKAKWWQTVVTGLTGHGSGSRVTANGSPRTWHVKWQEKFFELRLTLHQWHQHQAPEHVNQAFAVKNNTTWMFRIVRV